MADRNVTIRVSAVDNASQPLRNVADSMGRVRDEAGGKDGNSGLSGAMGRLGQELQTAVLGFGALKLMQTIGDMRDLGQRTSTAYQAFVNLNGGTREAEATLSAMRTATGGIVNDLDLMAGANRLLLMELAKNSEEAAKLTQIAVTLGRTMGKDAKTAFEDFSLLLSNRSIPRLDNFGISAANVRARVDELKDAGYGIEEAFTMAVLEEGERAMNRLGDAVEGSITAWDMLGVRLDNVKNRLADIVFQAGEAGSKLLLIPMLREEYLAGQRAEADAAREQFVNQMIAQGVTDITQIGLAFGAFNATLQGRDIDPGGMGINASTIAALEQVSGMGFSNMQPGVTSFTNFYEAPTRYASTMGEQRSAIQQAERNAQLLAQMNAIRGQYGYSGVTTTPGMRSDSATLRGLNAAAQRRSWVDFQNQYGAGGVGGWYGGGMAEAGTQRGYAQLDEIRAGARDLLGNIVSGISSRFEGARDSAMRIAGALHEAHVAATRIPATLNEWLSGGKPTGLEGELYGAIGAQMTPEEREQFMRGTGMVNWRDDLISTIAGMGPEGATRLAPLAAEWLQGGGRADSVAGAMGALGYYQGGGGGGSYSIQKGDTLSAIAAAQGMSVSQLMALNPGIDPRALQVGGSLSLGGGWQQFDSTMSGSMLGGDALGSGLSQAIQDAQSEAQTLGDDLTAAIETPRSMPITLDIMAETSGVTGPFRNLVLQVVAEYMRNNGGSLTPTSNKTGTRIGSPTSVGVRVR